MTSEFSNIYSRFFLRVQDYSLAGMEEDIVNEMMNGWIDATLSKPYIRRLFDTLKVDEYSGEIEYEMKFPVSDDEDQDFVEEMIVLGMIVEWISPKYYTTLNTSQFFSNSEQKFYSQANHMTELKDMFHRAKNDLRKVIRDRGYIHNGYLSEA